MPRGQTFEEKLINSLEGISSRIQNLENALGSLDKSRKPGAWGEKIKGRMKEQRKEQREQTQLDILVRDHKEMVKQSKYLFWAVVVAVVVGGAGVILDIVKWLNLSVGGFLIFLGVGFLIAAAIAVWLKNKKRESK